MFEGNGKLADVYSDRDGTVFLGNTLSRVILRLILGTGLVTAGLSSAPRTFFETNCFGCHNERLRTAGLALDTLDPEKPAANAETWERVISKLRAGSMPPPGLPRPAPAEYRSVATSLENQIDSVWTANPHPSRVSACS